MSNPINPSFNQGDFNAIQQAIMRGSMGHIFALGQAEQDFAALHARAAGIATPQQQDQMQRDRARITLRQGQQTTADQPATTAPPRARTVKVNGREQPDLRRVYDDDAIGDRGESFGSFRRFLEEQPRDRQDQILRANGMQRVDGGYAIAASSFQAPPAAATVSALTASGQPAASTASQIPGFGVFDWASRNPGLTTGLGAAAGFLTGGFTGAVGGAAAGYAAGAVGNAVNGAGSNLGFAVTALGMAGSAGGGLTGSTVGSAAMVGGLGSMATVANLAGFDGMAFQLRKAMNSVAEGYKDNAMIGMINDPSIPIESLIFLFLAHMNDKYEDKLREKMEETVRAEKKQREREMREQTVGALGGILSIFGPAGAAGNAILQMGVQKYNQIDAALNGQTKSTTMLMQEVQIIANQLKLIQELCSNLSKNFHDMAMTPIRNLR